MIQWRTNASHEVSLSFQKRSRQDFQMAG
jgi:hypothetical protein